MYNIRVGFGFDVHQLAEGHDFWLGGIKLDYHKGCIAHSDGDVLVHAICDALLGAANLRDIGYHFPDNDQNYKGIDSKILLKRTIEIIASKGYRVGNIDSTIALQEPKIKPIIPMMQQTLAEVMGIDTDCLSIKASTTEKMGFEGEGKGLTAYVTVLIYKE